MGKISINGLKLSPPLVLIRVRLQQGALAAMPAFCRMLADLAVNIAFMASGDLDDTCSAICCIDPTDRSSVVAGLAQDAELRTCVHIEPDLVGMISIYPHQSSMAILGASLQALDESDIGIYALASSISALTFIVGCLQTDKAVNALTASLRLPPDTVPSRAELIASVSQNGAVQTAGMDKNLETIAVYWEPIIRTYGFNLIEKLPLYRLSLPVDEIGNLGKALQLQGDEVAFRLVWATSDSPDQIHFFLLCNDRYKTGLLPVMGHPKSSGCNLGQREPSVLDVVFFQGPHFGDRSGIMNFTYQAIAHEQIPIRATACSVATIYLVVPAGWGRKTQDILTGAFEIPTSVK